MVDCFVPHVSDILDIANHSVRVVLRRHWQLTCLFLDKVWCRDNYFLPAGELSADSRGGLPDVAQQHTPVFFCTTADLAVCHSTDSHQAGSWLWDISTFALGWPSGGGCRCRRLQAVRGEPMRPGALCACRPLRHDVPRGVTAPTTCLLLLIP